jgi:hypothetical protein
MLSGCLSPAEQKAADSKQCEGYGFAQGTDAFANCMMKTANRRADETRRWQEEQDRKFQEQQKQQQQQVQAVPAQPAEPARMNCTTSESTTTTGNTTNVHSTTNCSSR